MCGLGEGVGAGVMRSYWRIGNKLLNKFLGFCRGSVLAGLSANLSLSAVMQQGTKGSLVRSRSDK